MRFFFDTEFIEDGITIDLISIGIVSADGREFYAESSECNLDAAGSWVKDNVVPYLRGGDWVMTRRQIAGHVISFVGDKPEFWADYGSYDWVALCQLYGTMMELPRTWPMFVRDIQQLRADHGSPELPAQGGVAHRAIDDARYCKRAHEFLRRGAVA